MTHNTQRRTHLAVDKLYHLADGNCLIKAGWRSVQQFSQPQLPQLICYHAQSETTQQLSGL